MSAARLPPPSPAQCTVGETTPAHPSITPTVGLLQQLRDLGSRTVGYKWANSKFYKAAMFILPQQCLERVRMPDLLEGGKRSSLGKQSPTESKSLSSHLHSKGWS